MKMENEKIPYKIYLNESEMPRAWYNLRADMKQKPAPLLNPQTHQPMKAEELAGVFCLHAHLATAARVKYPAALQRYKFDAPLLAAGSLTGTPLTEVPSKRVYSFKGRQRDGNFTTHK